MELILNLSLRHKTRHNAQDNQPSDIVMRRNPKNIRLLPGFDVVSGTCARNIEDIKGIPFVQMVASI